MYTSFFLNKIKKIKQNPIFFYYDFFNPDWYCNKCDVTFLKVLTSITRLEGGQKVLSKKVSDIDCKVNESSEKVYRISET